MHLFELLSRWVMNSRGPVLFMLRPKYWKPSVSRALPLLSGFFSPSNCYYRGVRGTQWPHVLMLCVLSSPVNNAQETLGLSVKSLSAAKSSRDLRSDIIQRVPFCLTSSSELIMRAYGRVIIVNSNVIHCCVIYLVRVIKNSLLSNNNILLDSGGAGVKWHHADMMTSSDIYDCYSDLILQLHISDVNKGREAVPIVCNLFT